MEPLRALPLEKRWQQQRYPFASVVAIVSRVIDGIENYLLIQRKRELYPGLWALPGGKWDFGESLAETVLRELNEETGLQPAFSNLRAIVNCRLRPRGQQDQGGHYLLFVCTLTAPLGAAQEQQEGSVAWFSAHELDQMNATGSMVPTDYLILDRCRQRASAVSYIESEIIGGAEGAGIEVVRFEDQTFRTSVL
jgi:ADP-ribose pyrophosphatase YjhB (NUDIX family)